MTFLMEAAHRVSEEFIQGRRDILRWFGKEVGGQTDYADRQNGMWASLMSSDARFWLTHIQQKLVKIKPKEFVDVDEEPGVAYVIDQAEKLGLCSKGMIGYLRGEFVHENGLPLVLDLKSAED